MDKNRIFQIPRGTDLYADVLCRRHIGEVGEKVKVTASEVLGVTSNTEATELFAIRLRQGWVKVANVKSLVSVAELRVQLSRYTLLSKPGLLLPKEWK